MAQGNVEPVFSKALNAACIVVGNSNTKFADGTVSPIDESKEKGKLEYVFAKGLPKDTSVTVASGGTVKITNSSFSEFCVPETDSICGVPAVEAAYLNWGGRLKESDLEKGKVVYVKLTGQDELTKVVASSQVLGNVADKDSKSQYPYYSCHADITEFLKSSINESGSYDLYVANIQTVLDAVTDFGGDYPSTSGWSLDLVLTNGSFPKRNIIIYQCDLMQVSGKSGTSGAPLTATFDFNKADAASPISYSVEDSITFCYSSFGALSSLSDDAIYWSDKKGSDYLIKFDKEHNDQLTGEDNHFNASIDYKYKTCKLEKKNVYTPGFDLHSYVFSPKPDDVRKHHVSLPDGATSFSLFLSGSNEHHYLTNVVLVTGAPEAPQVKLVSKTKSDIEPGVDYVDSLFFGVGENKEGLDSLTLTLPISEYVDTLTKLSFKWIVDSKQISSNSGAVIVKCDTFPGYKFNVPDKTVVFGNLQNENAFEEARRTINRYLKSVSHYNDSLRNVDPSKFKSARITFLFDKISVPAGISRRDVFRLDVGMRTKPEGSLVYNKNAYMGQASSITPEAEIGVSTSKTKQRSVFENTPDAPNYWDTYRCTYGLGGGGGGGFDGGGGGGDCRSLNNFSPSPQGLFVRDTLHEHISVSAGAKCRPYPDSLTITICGETNFTLEELNYLLVTKGKFDIAAFAKEDSCIWEERKRSELVNFAEKHKVNRSRLEALLSNSDEDLVTFAATKLNEAFNCAGVDGTVYKREIDSILNAKIRYSELWALYANKKDSTTSQTYNGSSLVTVSPKNYGVTYKVSKDTTLYMYYRSPWINKENDTCAYFIPIHFKKRSIDPPVLVYNGDTLQNRDTIFLCLEGELYDVSVRKTDYELDLYSSMSAVYKGDTLNWTNLHIFDGFDKTYNWNVQNSGYFTSDTSNFTRVAVRQQSFGCKGDSVVFFISVANMKIDQGPTLEDTAIYVCQTMDLTDSVQLRVLRDVGQEKFETRWYTRENISAKNVLIGTGDVINVRKDSAATFAYTATFFSNQCESKPSKVVVVVNPIADTIAPDTISVCQRYHLTAADVMGVLKMKKDNSPVPADKVKFYKYIDASDQSLEENVRLSISQDSLLLGTLLDGFDYESACQDGETRFYNFVAQALTDSACPGPGSLITVKINCFEETQPQFGFPGDSILYCMGSKGSADFDNFLSPDEKSKFAKHKWYWFDAAQDNHYKYFFGNDYYTTGENSAPVVDPSFVHSNLITVVRVDSNNCISLHDTFKVVVDTSINTYPIIADSVIPVADKRFTLTYCKGDYDQPAITIPAVGFPSADYRVEWYEKDDMNTTCNGIDSSGVVMQPSMVAGLEKADTTYYCVRQSTQMGCTGPWLTVQVVVYPDVSDQPTIGQIPEFCQGAIPVPTTVNAVNPDPDAYIMTYYRVDTTHVDGAVVKDTVTVPNIVPNTANEGVTTYYASLRDKKTKCQSPLFEIPVKVNHKPGSVAYTGDPVVLYCADGSDVDLAKDLPANVNANDYDTHLMWLPSNIISTANNAKVTVGIYQRDSVTGCLGDTTSLEVRVEKTFRYTPWGDRSFCWGETINVCDSINKRIRPINHYIDSTSIGYEVRRMVGKTAAKDALSCDVLAALGSKADRHKSDTTSYQITVLDSVSGCVAYDTVTIIFRGLPNAEPDKVGEYCEAFPTKLPTPDNNEYTYKWLRENGSESAETVTLDASEVFSLVEFDEFLCSDTFKVQVNVHSKPQAPSVSDLKLCQNGNEVVLPVVVTPDAEYSAENLQIQYFNHLGDSIPNKISTDTIAIFGLKRVLTFKARQTDLLYGCYNEAEFKVELAKGLVLNAPDMKAVCQPDTVDLAKHVKTYLSENLESVNLPNLGGASFEYGRLMGGVVSGLTEAEAAELVYVEGRDSVTYIYTVTDASNTCSASDTLFVVINKQPATPLVEKGADTLFFCAGNEPFIIGAENRNAAGVNSAIFWNGVSDVVPTDSVTVDIDVTEKSYSAYSKNLNTGCISVSDTVAVVVAKAIKVSPIAKNDTLELCAGEVFDVAAAATASFVFDEKRLSDISILASVNGVSTPLMGLSAVTSTTQDTIDYSFSAADALTGCEASNRLVLIYHKKPEVHIEAPDVVCQRSDVKLQAVGEDRAVSYAWYVADNKVVASTAAELVFQKAVEPVSFKLVETLNGTLCADSVSFDLDVVGTPNAFTDSSFVFCQQNAEELIRFARPTSDEVYRVEWSEDQTAVLSADASLPVDLSADTAYVLYARQLNEAKGLVCPSDWAKATVKVNKHIDVSLPDTFMCHPFEFNLALFAKNKKVESEPGFQLAVDRVFQVAGMGAMQAVADSSAVVEGGKYQINYLDKNGCPSSAVTKLEFIDKPSTPVVDVVDPILLCQGADTFITVNKIAGNFLYHWLPVGGNDTITADTLQISAGLPTSASLQVWRQDAKYGCESDKVEFKYSVIEAIATNNIDVQHLCEGEALDLDSLGRLAFTFSDELEYAYYKPDGSPMLMTNAVGDEGTYTVTARSASSGCVAKNKLTIDVHDNPVLAYKGDTVLCENDTFNLVAFTKEDMPDPVYKWTVGANAVTDSRLSFVAAVETPHQVLEQTAVLEGTYVISNSKKCVTERNVALKTNPAPDPLLSDTVELCQNTGVVNLPVPYEQGAYDLKIIRGSDTIPEISINTDVVASYAYNILQVNRLTRCKSPMVPVYANVHVAISLDLDDAVYVCEPETYDLLTAAADKALANNAYVQEMKQLSIVSVVSAGSEVDNAGKLDKSGTYVVTVADQYNCQAHDQIAVNFVAKPSTPVVDAASPILLCQGADTFITVKPVVGNYVYHWLPKGTIDTVTTDSFVVVAKYASASDQLINVWRQDADHGCESEKAEVSYRVVDSITTNLIDVQHLCEGETLDLDSLGRLAFNFNDDLAYAYSKADGSPMLMTNAVGSEGSYIVTANNSTSGCSAKAVLTIDVHDNPVLAYKGDTVLCENDTFNLVAFTKDDMPDPVYKWTVGENAVTDGRLSFVAAVQTPHQPLEQTAVLEGTYVITNSKKCVTERNVALKTNPAPDPLLSDTVELCQNTGVVKLPVPYEQGTYDLKIIYGTDTVPEISINTDDVANYAYNILQVNRLTKCKSPMVPVYANVHSAISLDLADEVYVCEPETYNLLSVATDSAHSNNGAIAEVKQLAILSVVSAGAEINNADNLDQSGTYVVTIADQYNCQAHDQIAVNFVAKPSIPEVDAASPILLCQGADTFITVKPVVGNYVYHWLPKGTIDTVTTDSYAVIAKFASASDQLINVWRQDADHGCESEKAEFSYRVVDSITTNLIDVQHLCEGETLDLDSLGRLAFNFNDDLTYAFSKSDGSPMLLTNAIGAEGSYIVTANNAASGCSAKNVLSIDVHENPVLLYKGDTVLCESDTFNLVAFTNEEMPDPVYKWTVDDKSVTDSRLSFLAAVQTPHQALEQTAVLEGTYVITNTKKCVTVRDVALKTNPAPDPLLSDTADLCQNTGEVTLPVTYDQAVYDLNIKLAGDSVPSIVVNTDDVENYVYTILQKNRLTKCKSAEVLFYVNVHPAISLKLPEIPAICQPAVVDFATVVNKATAESNKSVPENKKINTVAYYFNGVEFEDASALDQSGEYRAVIEDQYGCQASDQVYVSVGLQPEMVKADTGFCQSTGDRLLAGSGTSSNYALQWLALATAYPDSVYSDSLMVSTVASGEYSYLMRQVDRTTGCPSEVAPVTVTIYPALSVSLRDTMLCYGETFDFVGYAASQVKGGTNPVLNSYARTVAVSPLSYEAVAQRGDFYAVYTDDHACTTSDTMTVDFAPEIKVSISSNGPVCEGDTLHLEATGADFYAWNNMGATSGSFDIVTSEDGSFTVPLKAGIRVDKLTCELDSVIDYVVKVVPDLIPVADTAVVYCQGTVVEPLMLTPSLDGAKVLWYSPADNYASAAQNGTLVPSSQNAGTSVYRFRQQLDGCMTDAQEVPVEIQPAITELPGTSDTAYCLNEATVPLLAKVDNPLYDVVWTNADGDTLPLGYKPSSSEAGIQLFQARLHYRACYGKPVPERVTVSLPYGEKPDVDPSVIFCQNTGDYTLQANSIPSGARLNWYTTIGGVRYDSIVVPTAEGQVQWTSNSYYVTQSVIDGCESDPVEVVVDIKPSSENKVMAVDTCVNIPVKISNVFNRNGVTDVLDTLWRLDGGVKDRVENTANIGFTGTYYAATHNEWGCKALQTVNVRMLQVEDFTYSTIKTMYCFDDTVSLAAASSNSTFEWYNPVNGENSFSDSYTFRLHGPQQIQLVARVMSMPACTQTINYEFNTHPFIEPVVDGKTQICVGSQVQLSTSNVFNAEWAVFDSVASGDNFAFYPDQSCLVKLSGVDKNNCPVSKNFEISAAKVPNPVLEVVPSIHSQFYHLNRDTFDVKLNVLLEDNYDEGLTYYWNFGDGDEGVGSMSEYHEYDSARVRLTKPIPVSILVSHEYGCSGKAVKLLLVDPDFYVPNTMAAGETFMPSYELQIFDRIGNLIYEGVGWQGQKNNGDEAFADTYFYAINYYVDGDKKVKTGYITLVR
ncbi:MAG: gliding motility-associated C-terminal domain-containing protein [Paludibacteraceae bacterium]|nr:gliding motility-associated C-terminal domain-containing protein [Paludibacteraceae bacterium]